MPELVPGAGCPRGELANQAAASSASAGSKEGAAEPSSRARQHAVSRSKTLRFCCRQVATTLSMRSTNRLPAGLSASAAASPPQHAMAQRAFGAVVGLAPSPADRHRLCGNQCSSMRLVALLAAAFLARGRFGWSAFDRWRVGRRAKASNASFAAMACENSFGGGSNCPCNGLALSIILLQDTAVSATRRNGHAGSVSQAG